MIKAFQLNLFKLLTPTVYEKLGWNEWAVENIRRDCVLSDQLTTVDSPVGINVKVQLQIYQRIPALRLHAAVVFSFFRRMVWKSVTFSVSHT